MDICFHFVHCSLQLETNPTTHPGEVSRNAIILMFTSSCVQTFICGRTGSLVPMLHSGKSLGTRLEGGQL